jgi:hypothetical protein
MHQSHLYTQLKNISLGTVRIHSCAKTLGGRLCCYSTVLYLVM